MPATNVSAAWISDPDPIESYLENAVPGSEAAPRTLHRAIRHAVFTPGRRVRPRLVVAVATAVKPRLGEGERDLALRAACALELLHNASLVHDDLPAFDDAPVRRGHPTVQALFGEPIAILAGDAMLARSFALLAEAARHLASRALDILRLLGDAAGTLEGLIGGQALEVEMPDVRLWTPDALAAYHARKTAVLFAAACEMGAISVGAARRPVFRRAGHLLGMAYQLADDLSDSGAGPFTGKPLRQDERLGRPNATRLEETSRLRSRIRRLVDDAGALLRAEAADPAPIAELLEQLTALLGASREA